MNWNWGAPGKWLLVVAACGASYFLAFFFAVADISILAEPHLAQVAYGIHRAPWLVLRAFHWLSGLCYILIAILPPTLSIGFVLHRPWRTRVLWFWAVALTIFGSFYVWLAYRDGDRILESAALLAGGLLAFAIALRLRRSRWSQLAGPAIAAAYVVMFLPILVPILTEHRLPPEPHPIWSVTLQKEVWQAMNTGSEYDATRQMVFAGNRLVVTFDTGAAGYEKNWPMSRYRLVSLDLASGAIANQMEFTGRSGSLPHLYTTANGRVILQREKDQFLNADLTAADSNESGTPEGGERRASLNFDCGIPEILSDNRILVSGCGSMRLMTRDQRILVHRSDWEHAYNFGGVSADGRRFALQSFDEGGDPSAVLYEGFFIYDTSTLQPIAVIPVSDLPERQSWSALSPDGRYFAVGNPNRISLYQLP